MTATVDLRLAAEGPAGSNVPLLRLFDAAGNRVLNVYRQNANANRVYVVFGGVTYQTTGTLALNMWTGLSVQATVNGAAGTVQVKVNGVVVYANTAANLGTVQLTTLQLGNDTRKQAFDLYADNVVVREP